MSETERMKAERAAKIAAEEERIRVEREKDAGGNIYSNFNIHINFNRNFDMSINCSRMCYAVLSLLLLLLLLVLGEVI